ncbi:flagellar assembly protein FliH [Virgibacillus halodenitrificans]|uniref:flagellar assembly protein FliH n=1 Tax=Virgibacillus halodenitrificans TaxID=1482 RepID=UPI001F3A41E9|nr:flagellar assembly protein FliH [Virgibacillus halodenitrificans]MCG1028700.1 flagellar assembly protein FliH [Virgibacillus halodenitrificans]
MSNSNLSGKRKIEVKSVVPVPSTDPSGPTVPALDEVEKEISEQIDNLKLELEDLRNHKEMLLNETNAEIQQAKQNWETEKHAYIESAKKEGYQAGYKEGEEAAQHGYRTLIEQANSIVESAGLDYHTTIEKHEESIIELAVYTAEKILSQQLEKSPQSFLPIVKSAIRELKDQSVISIYLHPANYETVLEQKEELLQVLEEDVRLAIYINVEIPENGCLIKHPFGQMDAGIDTQLNELRQVLHEVSRENAT